MPLRKLMAAIVAAGALAAGSVAAKPGVKAAFIKGTFATDHECKKLRAVEAGGPKNVATAPELLTSGGFLGWENWCSFVSIKLQGGSYSAKMSCGEGLQEWTDTYSFKRRADGAFDVTVKGKTERYLRCDPKTKR
jgi:hypothetical protein